MYMNLYMDHLPPKGTHVWCEKNDFIYNNCIMVAMVQINDLHYFIAL